MENWTAQVKTPDVYLEHFDVQLVVVFVDYNDTEIPSKTQKDKNCVSNDVIICSASIGFLY